MMMFREIERIDVVMCLTNLAMLRLEPPSVARFIKSTIRLSINKETVARREGDHMWRVLP